MRRHPRTSHSEFLTTIRGLALGRKIANAAATTAIARFHVSKIERFAVLGELDLMDEAGDLVRGRTACSS